MIAGDATTTTGSCRSCWPVMVSKMACPVVGWMIFPQGTPDAVLPATLFELDQQPFTYCYGGPKGRRTSVRGGGVIDKSQVNLNWPGPHDGSGPELKDEQDGLAQNLFACSPGGDGSGQ